MSTRLEVQPQGNLGLGTTETVSVSVRRAHFCLCMSTSRAREPIAREYKRRLIHEARTHKSLRGKKREKKILAILVRSLGVQGFKGSFTYLVSRTIEVNECIISHFVQLEGYVPSSSSFRHKVETISRVLSYLPATCEIAKF